MTRTATKKRTSNAGRGVIRNTTTEPAPRSTPSKAAALAALERVRQIGDAEEQRETLDYLKRTRANDVKQP